MAAILCDSLFTHVFTLSVDEMQELFAMMGSRQMRAGESQLPLWEQEEIAAGWSAYAVSQ